MSDNRNTGHGHVQKRPDGLKARCGGPSICKDCREESERLGIPIMESPLSLVGGPEMTATEVRARYPREFVDAIAFDQAMKSHNEELAKDVVRFRPCCESFFAAMQEESDNEGYGSLVFNHYETGRMHIGYELQEIRFCPWCGSQVQQPK